MAILENLGLSYHYLVSRSGHIFEIVPPEFVAWHAGESFFPEYKVEKLNLTSIGISLVATETSGYSAAQKHSLLNLLNYLLSKYPIEAITSHQHIAPERKTDPWGFDWNFLKNRLKKSKVKIYV